MLVMFPTYFFSVIVLSIDDNIEIDECLNGDRSPSSSSTAAATAAAAFFILLSSESSTLCRSISGERLTTYAEVHNYNCDIYC